MSDAGSDTAVYENVRRLLVGHFRGLKFSENVTHGVWVRDSDNACCPILRPMRSMIYAMRMASGKKPKNPDEPPPVSMTMIRRALAYAGIPYRIALNFAQEYDAAIDYGVRPEKAIIAGIRAAALKEQEHRGSAHQVPVARECLLCGLTVALVEGKPVEHRAILRDGAPCVGRVGLDPHSPSDSSDEPDMEELIG